MQYVQMQVIYGVLHMGAKRTPSSTVSTFSTVIAARLLLKSDLTAASISDCTGHRRGSRVPDSGTAISMVIALLLHRRRPCPG